MGAQSYANVTVSIGRCWAMLAAQNALGNPVDPNPAAPLIASTAFGTTARKKINRAILLPFGIDNGGDSVQAVAWICPL